MAEQLARLLEREAERLAAEKALLPTGKYYNETRSAQPCGCDPGVPHLCERHSTGFREDVPPQWAPALKAHAKSEPDYAKERLLMHRATTLPDVPAERKKYPICSGVLDYFPNAIAAIARISYEGNQQHNPGEPLHWAREKSTDQEDTLLRHLMQRGTFDKDGQRHLAKAAWRVLAALELEITEGRGMCV